MIESFQTRAAAVGAEVHRFETKHAALGFILQFLEREGIAPASERYAVWAASAFLAGMDREALRATSGIRFDVSRASASQALVGVSQADWAVADTGSLVLDQSGVEQRLASSLPDIHIALVPTGNIVGGKTELFRRINPGTSRYIAFITGPSRTADIERVLTIGVHGPRRLVIVFVDELAGREG